VFVLPLRYHEQDSSLIASGAQQSIRLTAPVSTLLSGFDPVSMTPVAMRRSNK
jgi:hypothetical protein